MCEFISWKIEKSETGLKHVFAPSLNCHGDIEGDGYEAEWTDDGLEIRVPDNVSDHVADEIRTAVQNCFYDRDGLIDFAARNILANGQLPNIWAWENGNWNDRTKRLFACDCAEHVAHLYKSDGEWKPADTIAVARRFANGEATDEESDAASDAAWAAAWAAASDAAWDAAWAAASDAAWAAASAAARAAAWDAEEKWQAAKLLEYLDAK